MILLVCHASLSSFLVGSFSSQSIKRPISTLCFPPKDSKVVKGFRNSLLPSSILKAHSADDFEQDAKLDGDTDASLNSGVVPAVNATSIDIKDRAYPRIWPCFDKMDKDLIRISLPVIGNFAINPLIGAVDLFWVNRMGNALAVAGQAAANQVFSSAFWFTSFLPSGM